MAGAATENKERDSLKQMDAPKAARLDGFQPAMAKPLAEAPIKRSPSSLVYRWRKGGSPWSR